MLQALHVYQSFLHVSINNLYKNLITNEKYNNSIEFQEWSKMYAKFYMIFIIALGPVHWGAKYHHCVGKHQSPIDIEEQNVELVNLYSMVFENFDVPPKSAELINNGHTGKSA